MDFKTSTGDTGSSNYKLKIKRDSDDYFLDFDDDTFKASGWTTIAAIMTEIDAVNVPGEYEYSVDVTSWNDGVYTAYYEFVGSPSWICGSEFVLRDGKEIQESIRDSIEQTNPQNHSADANTETTGTLDAGNYASTATNDGVNYYQTSPVSPAVGGYGLNVYLTFNIGTGRVPSSVIVDGHFNAGALRTVQVWAFDYILNDYVQLSNSATDFGNAVSDSTYQYAMTTKMVKADGEVKIRFTSTSTNTGDDWYCDWVMVSSVALGAAGLTPDSIAFAVWNKDQDGWDEHTMGYVIGHIFLKHADIVSVTDESQFIIEDGVGNDDAYNGMLVMVEDDTDEHYEVRRITDYDGGDKEIIVDRPFSFLPAAGDDYYIIGPAYSDDSQVIADTLLNTVLSKSTYDIASSVGRRIREMITSVISQDDAAQGGGDAYIILSDDESSDDRTYKGNIVSITDGPGYGQSRLIVAYDGDSRTAYIDRAWATNPTDESTYIVSSNATVLLAQYGLVISSTDATITLPSFLSDDDESYVGAVLYITGGTGAGQIRVITAWDGDTKTATIKNEWSINPDTTSIFEMFPYGRSITVENWDKTGYELSSTGNTAAATAVMAKVVDGTVDVTKALKIILAMVIGDITRSGNTYTVKDQSGNTILSINISDSVKDGTIL